VIEVNFIISLKSNKASTFGHALGKTGFKAELDCLQLSNYAMLGDSAERNRQLMKLILYETTIIFCSQLDTSMGAGEVQGHYRRPQLVAHD